MKKRAIAGIISVLIIIVLSIMLVILIWNFYQFFLKSRLEQISINRFLVSGELEYYLPDDFAIVDVKRPSDTGTITGMVISFSEKDTGAMYSYNTSNYPRPLETRRYVIFKQDLNPNITDSGWNFTRIGFIALHYIFADGTPSDELDKKEVNSNKISTNFKKTCLYNDSDKDGYGAGTECVTSPIPISGKSPSNDDCNDTNNLIHPGANDICDSIDNDCDGQIDEAGDAYCSSVDPAHPYCSLGSCSDNKNYTMTSVGLSSLWVSDTDCITGGGTWTTISTFPQQVALPWTMKFYKDNMDSVYICKQGHLVFSPGDCYTSNNNPVLNNLKLKKIISPYMMITDDASGSVSYCSSPDYIVFRWADITGTMSEAILHKNDDILFSYSESSDIAEVGLSYDNTGIYYTEKVHYGSTINNDYKFIF